MESLTGTFVISRLICPSFQSNFTGFFYSDRINQFFWDGTNSLCHSKRIVVQKIDESVETTRYSFVLYLCMPSVLHGFQLIDG